MYDFLKTYELFDLTKTIAAPLFERYEYPWQVLPEISDFIKELIAALPDDIYEKREGNVCIARSAKIAPTAFIGENVIICEDAEVRHCAFIRTNAIVGRAATVGNSTELKNAILFDGAQAPHFNYVGDSVYGYKAHTGAGVITSNLKSDKTLVSILVNGERVPKAALKNSEPYSAIMLRSAAIRCLIPARSSAKAAAFIRCRASGALCRPAPSTKIKTKLWKKDKNRTGCICNGNREPI